jgi:SAM-dependent methyltransferase
VLALEHDGPAIYNIVDDDPSPKREWLSELAKIVGAKPPRRLPRWLARPFACEALVMMATEARGASNAKAKRELGSVPRYPSWRQGFVETYAQAVRVRVQADPNACAEPRLARSSRTLAGPAPRLRRVLGGHEAIERAYRRHHATSRHQGFVYCGPERIPLFRAWVGGPGLRVLDLGCRDGALTSAYLGGNNVVGVDVDREALACAAARGVETAWVDLDDPLPFEDESFDVVVAAEVLEHLRLPERVVAEARRVLRPGGLFVGSVPNCFRLKSRLRFLLGRQPESDPTLLHLFDPSAVCRLLEAFDDVETRCIAGRLVRLSGRLFANDIAFRARKPRLAAAMRSASRSPARATA